MDVGDDVAIPSVDDTPFFLLNGHVISLALFDNKNFVAILCLIQLTIWHVRHAYILGEKFGPVIIVLPSKHQYCGDGTIVLTFIQLWNKLTELEAYL